MAQTASRPTLPLAPPEQIAPALEAILMSVDRPVPASALAVGLLRKPTANADQSADEPAPATRDEERVIEEAVALLNGVYTSTRRSFRIEPVAGGYRIMTVPDLAPAVAAFHRARQSTKLTRAAVETLAIIAYKQPITRAELEAIRGVACGEVLRTLVDRRMVTIKGRAEELGRPLLYGTTKQFLDAFGLASLKDLPTLAELKLAPVMSGPTPGPVPGPRDPAGTIAEAVP